MIDGMRFSSAYRAFGLKFLLMMIVAILAFGLNGARAAEPVKISRDDTALDLTATTDIYTNQGEAFQVSTAAGGDGIRRRIEVRSSNPGHQGDWAVLHFPTSRKSSWSASSSHRIFALSDRRCSGRILVRSVLPRLLHRKVSR